MPIVFIRYHHTLRKLPYYMKVAGIWLIFGDPFHISYFANFLKLFDNLTKFLLAEISNGIPCLFAFLRNLTLVLKPRAVTNPFRDLPNFPFDSKNVVFILFRLSNFAEIFKVKV